MTIPLNEYKELVLSERTYKLHKIPAFEGLSIYREYDKIAAQGTLYDASERDALLLRAMQYVKVVNVNGNDLTLDTPLMISNHVSNLSDLARIERELKDYNYSFFQPSNIPNQEAT